MASLKQLQDHQEARMITAAAQARADRSSALMILITAGIVAVLLAAISALFITRRVSHGRLRRLFRLHVAWPWGT